MRRIAFVVATICLLSVSAFAGKGGANAGGGGVGLRVKSGVFLLDLIAADVQDQPYFKTEKPVTYYSLDLKSPERAWLPHDLLSRKLADIESMDPVFAAAVYETILTLTWHKTSLELTETEDAGTVPVKGELVQLARRDGAVVRVQEGLWNELNDGNKTALIIHEAVAALAGDSNDPQQVREIVAQIFMPSFYGRDRAFVMQTIKGFPSTEILYAQFLPTYFTHTTIAAFDPIYPSDPSLAKFYEQGSTLFVPTMTFKWDGDSPRTEMDEMYLFPGAVDTSYFHFCQGPHAGELKLTITEYRKIEVTLPAPDKDGQIPHVAWALQTKLMKTLGRCGPAVVEPSLQVLRNWAKTVRQFN
jgi:hypothetical protein